MNANNAARGVGGLLRFLGGHVGLGWCWLKGQCLDLFRLVYRIKHSLFGIFSGIGTWLGDWREGRDRLKGKYGALSQRKERQCWLKEMKAKVENFV